MIACQVVLNKNMPSQHLAWETFDQFEYTQHLDKSSQHSST